MRLIFYSQNCETTHPDMTPELVAERLNKLGAEYDASTGIFRVDLSSETFYSAWIYALSKDGSETRIDLATESGLREVALTESQKTSLEGFRINLVYSGISYSDKGITFVKAEEDGTFIYPSGEIDAKALPITFVGFKNHQTAESYTHIRFMVAEIQDDGTIGGEGHVWHSEPYDKNIDFTHTLSELAGICEGKRLANFNVLFELVAYNSETGEYEFVDSFIVGDATNVTTFSVRSDVSEEVVSFATLDGVLCCLDPCILTVNRYENREIQFVRVEVSNYIADFEFYQDRNLLEIDIAEYLQTLFALVDLFEFQQMQTTVVVKLYNADWEHLETQGLPVTVIYGKKPDAAITGREIRVQWLDKYAVLHDEYFKIADNTTEGASKQKYVVNRKEREDKTGEKSITLAKVLANNAEREALKTIVFADHVRAYIGDTWKRVKIANTYKTGAGREKKNFEITIKYSL